MQSFKRGFAFLKQSWQMALADPDLLKPSIYTIIAGFFVTILLGIPIGVIGWLLGDGQIGRWIMGLLGAVLVFVQFIVSYVFSAMTVYLIYGYLAEGDGRMDKAWAIVKRDFLDILALAAASTVVNLVKNFLSEKGKSGGKMAANIINTIWTEAAYLVLPVMVIEDVNLADGLKRVGRITKDNLLLIGVSTVGVGLVTGLIGFLLGALGIGLGAGIGLGIVALAPENPFGIFAGVTLGVLIAGIFIIAATVIGSYTSTAYHTCLYLWARDVEKARMQSASSAPLSADQVAAPAPLASVLGQ